MANEHETHAIARNLFVHQTVEMIEDGGGVVREDGRRGLVDGISIETEITKCVFETSKTWWDCCDLVVVETHNLNARKTNDCRWNGSDLVAFEVKLFEIREGEDLVGDR